MALSVVSGPERHPHSIDSENFKLGQGPAWYLRANSAPISSAADSRLSQCFRFGSISYELFGSRGCAVEVGGDSPTDDFPWSNLLHHVIVAGIDRQPIRYDFCAMLTQTNVKAGVKRIALALVEMKPVALQNRIQNVGAELVQRILAESNGWFAGEGFFHHGVRAPRAGFLGPYRCR